MEKVQIIGKNFVDFFDYYGNQGKTFQYITNIGKFILNEINSTNKNAIDTFDNIKGWCSLKTKRAPLILQRCGKFYITEMIINSNVDNLKKLDGFEFFVIIVD